MTRLGRLLRTLYHATPLQIASRALHEARLRAYPITGPLLAKAFPDDPAAKVAVGPVAALREGPTDFVDPATQPALTRLQKYERQYHDAFVPLARLGRLDYVRALAADWAASYPIGSGEAWEPYPVARRVLSWSQALAIAPDLGPALAPSLAAQVRFLRQHVEFHLMGNHVLCDASAIVAGAAVLDVTDSAELFAHGADLLSRELERQTLGDGGYAERTALYHATVLRDALVALALARAREKVLPIEGVLARLARWLVRVRRADGSFPCLNDSTPQAAAVADEALALAARLGLDAGARPEGDVELRDTGWAIAREAGHELLFDTGPLGPDEQPGHGHSDALAYELIWAGVPVVTDTGASTYEPGEVRDFERSVRAHATVSVGGEGPDELWAAFRVGARGEVAGAPEAVREGVRVMRGRVDAPGSTWDHRRTLVFWPGRILVVVDRVDGEPMNAEVVTRVPFDPAWAVGPASASHAQVGTLSLDVLRGRLHEFGRTGHVARGFGLRDKRAVWSVIADPQQGVAAYAIAALGASAELRDGEVVLRDETGERRIATEW